MNIPPAVVCCLLICFSSAKSEQSLPGDKSFDPSLYYRDQSNPNEVKKNEWNNGKPNKQAFSPEYKAAMNEAIDMMATNNKNITQLSTVIDKLLKYSPIPSNLNSTILIQKVEEEVKKNVTATLGDMFGKSPNGTSLIRLKRATSACVNTTTTIGSVVGAAAGGALAGYLVTMVLPGIGTALGAYFGGMLGAPVLSQIDKALGNWLCPKK